MSENINDIYAFRMEMVECAQQFKGYGGMPCVLGSIDGTHVGIKAPQEEEWIFVNRKQSHSLNVQVSYEYTNQQNW